MALFMRRVSISRVKSEPSGPAPLGRHPAERQHGQPACAASDSAERIAAVNLLDMEAFPYRQQVSYRCIEVFGAAGQGGGVDSASRRPRDHRKWVELRGIAVTPDLSHRIQHTYLICRTRAASGEYQTGLRSATTHEHARPIP
jgi:hypothetical protein